MKADNCQAHLKKDGRTGCVVCLRSWASDEVFSCPLSDAPSSILRPEVLNILEAAAATFADRNKQYGGNYKRIGDLLMAIFPEGGIPVVNTKEDANRLNLLIDCLGKLQRYAHAFKQGGHKDSAHDLIVYAAMLEEMTK